MFKRIKPLVIHGRTITQPGAAQLAEYMTEERALFVAHLLQRFAQPQNQA